MQTIDLILDGFSKKFTNLIVMRNDWFVAGDHVFYAGTLWSLVTEESYFQTPIYWEDHLITVEEWNQLHREALIKLGEAIEIAHQINRTLVVATHYAPTYHNTLSPKYHNHRRNAMYCSHLELYLQNRAVVAWIYGHTGFNGRYRNLTTNQITAKEYNTNLSLHQLLYNQPCNIYPIEENPF